MAEVQFAHSPTRCPYCHDGIHPEEFPKTRVCADCLARHHADCWEGACASCGSARAFVEPPPASASPPIGTASPESEHERWVRHGLNKAATWLTAAYWGLMTLGAVLTVALGFDPGAGAGFPWPMWPGLAAAFALALVLIPLPFINVQDALRRRRTDPTCGPRAVLYAAIPWFTAGVSAVYYHWTWGSQPLLVEDDAPEPPAVEEPDEPEVVPTSKLKT